MTDLHKYKDVIAAFFAYHGIIKHIMLENCAGLTKSQAMMMATISELGSVNMSTLAQRIAVSKEQATRAVQPLVEAGYVQRNHDANNRRMVNISLTPAGDTLLYEHFTAVENMIGLQLQSLTEDEQTQLTEASNTAVRLLRKALNDQRGGVV